MSKNAPPPSYESLPRATRDVLEPLRELALRSPEDSEAHERLRTRLREMIDEHFDERAHDQSARRFGTG